MRKKIKLFCYVILVFLITMFFSYKTSAMEVTTEVKGKLAGECLSKHGAEAKLVKTSTNNDFGGKVTVNSDSNWTNKPVTVTLDAYASSFDELEEVWIEIYNSKGDKCSEKLPLAPGVYQHARFEIVFKDKSVWQYIKAWEIDTSGKEGTGDGDDIIRLDIDPPSLTQFDVEIGKGQYSENRHLDIQIKLKDTYSKLKKDSVILTIEKNNEIIDAESEVFITDDDNVWSLRYFNTLDVLGEGVFKITIKAEDKVGNPMEEWIEISSLKIDEETGEITEEPADGKIINQGSNTPIRDSSDDDKLNSDLGLNGNGDYKFSCDDDIINFINKLWNMLLVAGPILMLVMSTIEFVKPILASDADALSKAGSNTVKRAIAFVCLLLLKVILSTILNLFGIGICW